jgi:hypothetical protein
MFRSALAILTLALGSVAANAATMVLYDGSLNTTPDQQKWNYQAMTTPPFGIPSATQSASGGVTTLDTTPATSDRAGYSSNPSDPNWPTLDRSGDGYTIRFKVRIQSETHSSNDRAGFSAIVLSSDKKGLELAFWGNEIWAQHDDPNQYFTHGEGVALDSNALIEYDLAMKGGTYWLLAGGTIKLTGPVRDYTGYTGPIDPYETPSFLFFGDDTSSAAARADIAKIEFLDYATPEPASLALLAAGGLALIRRRRG